MQTKQLGSQGLHIPLLGLGCMNLSGSDTQFIYGKVSENEGIAIIQRALELGVNFHYRPPARDDSLPGRFFPHAIL